MQKVFVVLLLFACACDSMRIGCDKTATGNPDLAFLAEPLANPPSVNEIGHPNELLTNSDEVPLKALATLLMAADPPGFQIAPGALSMRALPGTAAARQQRTRQASMLDEAEGENPYDWSDKGEGVKNLKQAQIEWEPEFIKIGATVDETEAEESDSSKRLRGGDVQMSVDEAEVAETANGEGSAAESEPTLPPPEEPTAFDLLDVRVGTIVEAWEHPDSDKLWVEKIDVGEAEPRQIASGLRAYYATKEDLEGRKVLVVCNLKEAKLGGVASNGMVLCASSEDKSAVAFVEPPADAVPGARVLAEGVGPTPPATGNQVKKKKYMQKAAEGLRTVSNTATFEGVPLVVAGGKCTSPSIESGTIN